MELKDTIGFKTLSAYNYGVSAFGAGVSDLQWTATSLSSGNRYCAGNDTAATNANHRITQVVAELIRKGIFQGTIG